MKRSILYIYLIAAVLLIAVFSVTAVYADSPSCISELKIAYGGGAVDELENDGYDVIYQNLNPSDGDKLYIGYKTGKDAITGLMTCTELKDSIGYDGADYTPVSSVNLNEGTDRGELYLYFTKDESAGGGIVSLTFVRENVSEEYGALDYFNDGSIPVRNPDGTPADFETGAGDYDLYCFMIKENVCLPYVSELKTVDIGYGEDIFSKLAATGCNYYDEISISGTESGRTFLCYNRTDDESLAVRAVYVSDGEFDHSGEYGFIEAGSYTENGREYTLWYTTDENAGEAAAEISGFRMPDDIFERGEWATTCFEGRATGARTQLYKEDAYRELKSSDEPYRQFPIYSYELTESGVRKVKTDIYVVRTADGITPVEPKLTYRGERCVIYDGTEEDTESENKYKTDGLLRDEQDESVEKSETSDTESHTVVTDVEGSAIGAGNMLAIAILLMIAVIVTFVFVIIKNRGGEEAEEK